MRLNNLRLRGFRNYEELDADFVPGVNLILGDNAQGKTNLLEAICYLSTGHGFRTRKEAELIGFGAGFADLEARVYTAERDQTLRAVLYPGRKPRQLWLNGVKQKSFQNLSGLLTTVLFCPEDLLVLKTGASARRRLLDQALCQLRPGYDRALTEYNRLLDHKARILKDWRDRPDLLQALPEFNLRMALVGSLLIGYRANYLEKLDRCTARYHREFSGGAEELKLTYRTVSTVDNPRASRQTLEQQLLDHQRSHEHAELESGQCLSGPHKDDFDVILDGVSLKAFGSQGQTRTAAISLKLAEREIFRDDTGEEPVLLLDDVLSELDARRQDFVLNQIKSGQVFITCCETDRLTKIGAVTMIRAGRKVDGCTFPSAMT